jgi:hypothetical protein
MTAFLITVLQMGFVLTERGLYSPRLIGLWSGLAALANPVGAWLFGVLRARMILPTLITWAISTLPAAQRGTGTGLWMAASFLGQFLSPLAVPGLRQITGSLSGAILVYAVACGLFGLSAMARLRGSRPPAALIRATPPVT